MSHEIRTPLTSIIGFAEAIGDEVRGLPDDVAERVRTLDHFAGLIERSGHRLLETLDAVLNLSKLQAGEVELEPRPVDIADEANEVAELLATQAESNGLELRANTETTSDAVWARADEGAIRVVLRNLVSNAIKYTPEGGTVWVRVGRRDDTVVLEVEDTGIGIDPDRVPDIFEAFRQESEGANHSFEGIGLGLAVTRQLVERMDGTIDVATEKDEGTCFTVRLPPTSPPDAS
jgi:signal transduction histidine kinase